MVNLSDKLISNRKSLPVKEKGKIITFKNWTPKLGKDCYLAPGSVVLGDVKIGDHVSIWFNAVLRGDVGPIEIGNNVNIQDLSMLHITDDIPLVIEDNVTIGHSVTLHSCEIKKGSLIGMGSTILDNAVIGENCLVAAGSLVPPGKKYPDGVMIRGNPAVVARELTAEEIHEYSHHYQSYIKTKDAYLDPENFN